MAANTFGEILRLTTFGESHGHAIGGVLDGMPSGILLDTDAVQHALDRRRPGQSGISTPRKESDTVKILSGVFEGLTTGTPIGLLIENENQHSSDYSDMKDKFRPSHADYTYFKKYGVRDYPRRRAFFGAGNRSPCSCRGNSSANSACRSENNRLCFVRGRHLVVGRV